MSSTSLPFIPRYIPANPTEETLKWADLPVIDLAKAITPEGRAELAPQVRDETYNLHRSVYDHQHHPKVLEPALPELRVFAEHNHFNVLFPVCLRSGWSSRKRLRFMKYYPRTAEEEQKTSNVWLKGHTDFGTITILWSQPVTALQILSPDGLWRFVKHVPNALVISAGDCMEFLSGGYYKATVHRVVQPPADQRGHTRVAAFYFAMADDVVVLRPLAESPVLQRVGIVRRFEDEDTPTTEEWRRARTSAYGQTELTRKDNVEEEVINGIVVKHYN